MFKKFCCSQFPYLIDLIFVSFRLFLFSSSKTQCNFMITKRIQVKICCRLLTCFRAIDKLIFMDISIFKSCRQENEEKKKCKNISPSDSDTSTQLLIHINYTLEFFHHLKTINKITDFHSIDDEKKKHFRKNKHQQKKCQILCLWLKFFGQR